MFTVCSYDYDWPTNKGITVFKISFGKAYHRIYGRKISFTATRERVSERISDDIPPKMKILNMVIPFLMHFCSFVSNWSFAFRTSLTKCDVMTSKCFVQYIAGYTVAKFWRYPIRSRVTKKQTLVKYSIMLHFIWVFTGCQSTRLGVFMVFKGLDEITVNWWASNCDLDSVKSEIFARVLFSRNFAYAKFRENKTLVKCRNHSVDYWYR